MRVTVEESRTTRVQPCLLARKACLHGHHGRLLLHTRCSQTHILRVHASDECVQGYKHRVQPCTRRLLGYTGVALLCIGVSRANKHGWWTNKHRWWTGLPSLLSAFPDSLAVCRGSHGRVILWKTCQPRSMAGESRCPSFTLYREVLYVSLPTKRTRDRGCAIIPRNSTSLAGVCRAEARC
jgi:hypothetical protein